MTINIMNDKSVAYAITSSKYTTEYIRDLRRACRAAGVSTYMLTV